MRGPARRAIEELLASSEQEGHCYVPQTRTEARQLARAVTSGIATRPYAGIYATAEGWRDLNAEKQAYLAIKALAMLHPSWVFAGPTAAFVHGLSVGYRWLECLYIATGRKSHTASREGIQRVVVSDDTDVERDGVRVTSFARTLYDCLRIMPFADALAVADSALRIKKVDCSRLAENVARLCRHRRDIRKVLGIIGLADGRSENGGESIARAQMIALGYATPDLQRVMDDPLNPEKGYRVDFAWDLSSSLMVAGELDGRDKYVDAAMLGDGDTVDALLAERRREAHVTAGERVVKVMRFSLAEAQNTAVFERLLNAYQIPRVGLIPVVASPI